VLRTPSRETAGPHPRGDRPDVTEDRAHCNLRRTTVAVVDLQADAQTPFGGGTGEHAFRPALQQAPGAGLGQQRAVEPIGSGDQQRVLRAGRHDSLDRGLPRCALAGRVGELGHRGCHALQRDTVDRDTAAVITGRHA
jgi:hypothetical protein